MMTMPWPDRVLVEDYGFGAIAMMQRLQDDRPARAIFLTAEVRGRTPGTLHVRRCGPSNATPTLVQAYMAEAGGGVVAIDPLLVIAEYFQALPAETFVIELEPIDTGWGEPLSPGVEALFPMVESHVRELVAQ